MLDEEAETTDEKTSSTKLTTCPGQHTFEMVSDNASTVRANLLNLISDRRSVRKYRKIRPSPSEIDMVVGCAAYAPSAHNAQPWRFFVIDSQAKKADLIKIMATRFEADMERDNVPQSIIQRKLERSLRLFSGAPVLIIACINMAGMNKYPDLARQQAELTMATQSLAAAIQNLLLAAEAVGLAGCWYCAPLFCPDVVKRVLSLDKNHIPQALITLGYPAEKPKVPPKLGIDEIRFTI